ncbi:MAG: hypothetical protein QXL15_02900 [Candidatus Korarchaeota archaeon]
MASGKAIAVILIVIIGLGVILYYDGIIGTNKIGSIDASMVGQKVRIRGIVDSRISFLGIEAISVKDDSGSITATLSGGMQLPAVGMYIVVEGLVKQFGNTFYIEVLSWHEALVFR